MSAKDDHPSNGVSLSPIASSPAPTSRRAEPPVPIGEAARLADLYAAGLVGSGNDEAYDAIARTAAFVADAPAALITLIDDQQQTTKACIGFTATTIDRRDAFCSYAILEPDETLHVPDATLDVRFRDNPLVVGEPHLRFYCGVPIVSAAGRPYGTLCVVDFTARELDTRQLQALEDLAAQASALIQARVHVQRLEDQVEQDTSAHIEVLRAVGDIAATTTELDDLLERSLSAIVDTLGLAAGGLWWHDGENLAVDPLWIDPTAQLTSIQRAREGLAYSPAVIVHTLETATRHGADVLPTVVMAAMQEAGITGSHMVPITVDRIIIGAFELIPDAASEPSPRNLLAATQAAAEIGRWIEHDRSPQWAIDATSPAASDANNALLDPTRVRRQATIKTRLDRAVTRGDLMVAFEPIVRVSDDTVTAVEVLARWHDDELGVVNPEEFIPVAEKSETIRALGTFVRRRALLDLPQLGTLGQTTGDLGLWANVSARELTDGFADAVLAELRLAGIDPRRLTLEVTERIALTPHDRATAQLGELRALGVGVAIDDFGTGFTSLTQLRTLPMTHVKIDRSFTADLVGEHSARVRPIVSGIVQLGHSLGLKVVAEGVDTHAHLEVVRELGAELAQGYLLSGRAPLTMG